MSNRVRTYPEPLLKWAGGKRQLLPDLRKRVAMAGEFGRYHEPFVGGGALYFALYRDGKLNKKKAFLADNNSRLIETYEGVRDDVETVITLLEEHRDNHSEAHFYDVRAAIPETLAARAARIIYLNRTCFNGLYRENSRGLFNVPFGNYKKPRICDPDNLRAVAAALRKASVECRDFASVAKAAKPGDFVYFDPPYHPVSKTSSFTAYHQGGFGEAEQRKLAEVFGALTKKGVKALLSNSWTPLILELYEPWKIEEVKASRNVNSKASGRGKISEVLVRNFDGQGRMLTR
jgi:DNA adenine methylase